MASEKVKGGAGIDISDKLRAGGAAAGTAKATVAIGQDGVFGKSGKPTLVRRNYSSVAGVSGIVGHPAGPISFIRSMTGQTTFTVESPTALRSGAVYVNLTGIKASDLGRVEGTTLTLRG